MGLPARSFPHSVQRIAVNATGITLLELVAAVANRRIRVIAYSFTLSGTVGLEFRSGSTPLTGRMVYAANGQATGSLGSGSLAGVFQTANGEALNLDIDAAINVDGHLEFVVI